MNDMQDELERLERRGWDSLCDGTGADFYGRAMAADAVMVLANGMILNRDQVVESLRDAPPWAGYELRDIRVAPVGARSAALVYVGAAHRDDGSSVTAAMTSVWSRGDDGWKLALYTQTPVVT